MRGVNKMIIEVNTDNEYFDKAILFLKPNVNAKQSEISRSADALLNAVKSHSYAKSRLPSALWLIFSAGIGAFITGIVLLFLI